MAIERHGRPRAAAEIELGSHVRQRVSAAEDRAFEQHQHDAEQRREDRSKGGQNSAHNAESGTSPEPAQARSCRFWGATVRRSNGHCFHARIPGSQENGREGAGQRQPECLDRQRQHASRHRFADRFSVSGVGLPPRLT